MYQSENINLLQFKLKDMNLIKNCVAYGLIFCLSVASVKAQNAEIVSGPMLGFVELRTATIWAEFSQRPENLVIEFAPTLVEGNDKKSIVSMDEPTLDGSVEIINNYGHYIVKFLIANLSPQTKYSYTIVAGRKKREVIATGNFTTQTFWQWRTPVPDFSFIAGSCSYFNQPEYDRIQGKSYGGDSSIFKTMANENAAFMLWLGDNWYTRVPDYFSEWGLNYRAGRERAQPILQPLLKAMPQMAIWDDHDFGPNDAGSNYVLKSASREVFRNYWGNNAYGENGQGIYTHFTWNDVDFFLLDDRSFRSNDDMADSINGKPNTEKQMFGKQQMTWLKNSLLQSNNNPNISFRFIVNGSQVLNPLNPYDCFKHFSAEYEDLMSFIDQQGIKGLLFLTGDRHHSEIIKSERPGKYTLYDITASPLTSGIGITREPEKSSPYRVGQEIDQQNFARISFSGPVKQRKLQIEFLGIDGKVLENLSLNLQDLGGKK